MIEPSLPPTREECLHSPLLLPAPPLLVFCFTLLFPGLSAGFQILLVLHPLVFHIASFWQNSGIICAAHCGLFRLGISLVISRYKPEQSALWRLCWWD